MMKSEPAINECLQCSMRGVTVCVCSTVPIDHLGSRRECFVAWWDRGRMNAYREQQASYTMPRFIESLPGDVVLSAKEARQVIEALDFYSWDGQIKSDDGAKADAALAIMKGAK